MEGGVMAEVCRVLKASGVCSCLACEPIIVEAFETPEAPVTCPSGSLKAEPGVCGCGVPDADFDADGAMDCVEGCPDNAARTSPVGACGCSALADTAACTALRGALRNLYTFNGAGITVIDSVSAANGELSHTVSETPAADLERLQLNGRLSFDGLGSYVDLPDAMISNLTSATFEVWLTWYGGGYWTRIFDFGNSVGDAPATGQTYLFLTTTNSLTDVLRVTYSLAGNAPAEETVADGPVPLPISGADGAALEHVAVVIDDAADAMRLYWGGVEVSSVALANGLVAVNDVNNWLGRSNFELDPPLFGALIEFRIYDQALSAAQISTSFQAGPGALD
jgi:hypothetical protein